MVEKKKEAATAEKNKKVSENKVKAGIKKTKSEAKVIQKVSKNPENEKEVLKEKPVKEDESKQEEVGEDKPIKSKSIKDLSYFTDIRKDIPVLKPGDIIRVSYRVIEGGKERTQLFEGTVIAIKNPGISKTITVRKASFGIAIERIFPINSKLVQKIEIKKHSKVRRSKLYYIRKLKGKAARLKELR